MKPLSEGAESALVQAIREAMPEYKLPEYKPRLRQVLFLDDCSDRCHWACANLGPMDAFLPVSTAAEAIDILSGHPEWGITQAGWDEVYLDHDLDPGIVRKHNPTCGCNVVHWLVQQVQLSGLPPEHHRPKIGKIICHSMDEVSGNRMAKRLRRHGYNAEYISFMRLVDAVYLKTKSPSFFT